MQGIHFINPLWYNTGRQKNHIDYTGIGYLLRPKEGCEQDEEKTSDWN